MGIEIGVGHHSQIGVFWPILLQANTFVATELYGLAAGNVKGRCQIQRGNHRIPCLPRVKPVIHGLYCWTAPSILVRLSVYTRQTYVDGEQLVIWWRSTVGRAGCTLFCWCDTSCFHAKPIRCDENLCIRCSCRCTIGSLNHAVRLLYIYSL